ncbi:Delta(24)-sterol reductase-like 1 [Homarus americanus]|uniref:Delta(24)-sterol reductase n=1 Tax=Homarus americanus TaxID=6706 RepID=A0A8J5MQX9_HOMAM|nr:Delta(24)-sterol reductase-like 1 [Homarus americanus]
MKKYIKFKNFNINETDIKSHYTGWTSLIREAWDQTGSGLPKIPNQRSRATYYTKFHSLRGTPYMPLVLTTVNKTLTERSVVFLYSQVARSDESIVLGSEMDLKQRIARWMEDHRGLIVVLVVLPLSLIFDALIQLRLWIIRKFISAPEKHDERVLRWNKHPKAERKLMCTARPNWQSLSTTFFRKDLCHKISIPLYDILELRESHMTIRVEPMVSVGQATAFLVPRGYTLAVCLEVAEATLGGLAMGVGMTTYSHKIGLYQEGIVAYEVVLADGSLVKATKDNEYSDLYYTLPWSHGTLGFLPHLKLEYIPVKGQKQYCDMMRDLSGALDKNRPTPDYLEATVYNREEAVIMVGNFADVPDTEQHKINRVTAWHKPWFYKHAEGFLKTGKDYEYIPLKDYLLRHNKSIFWVIETMIPFGNNPIFRFFLGWLLPPKIAFLKFTTTPGVRAITFTKQVFQDIVLPMTQLEDQIDKNEELFDIYPILIYPCRIYDHGPHRGQLRPPRREQMVPGADYGMFNDLGVYGVPRVVKEKKRFDAEFEKMFDLMAYDQVRRKYNAEGAFPHLHDKIKPEIDVVEVGKQYMDPL